MNKYEKLLKNSGVFFIANFGTKIVTFLMVRFYTEVLTAEEYGIVDLLFTTVNLVVPIITLCITEAVLRFSIDDIKKQKEILSWGYFIAITGNLLFLLSAFLLCKLDAFKDRIWLFYLLSVTNSIQMITLQFTRGIGKTKLFALTGFLQTVFQVGFNILFLLVFKFGISGYLLASIVANVFTISIAFILGNLKKYIKIVEDFDYLKKMLKYSAPLVPNSVCWWLTQSSSRYIIKIIISSAATGLFAAANKLPTIISTLSGIFFQAWQLSAVKEANSSEKDNFYTSVFKSLSMVLICATSFCLVILQPLYKIFVNSSYYSAWQCAPFLFISMLFSCYSSFIGTNYTTMKKTKGVFITTLIGGIVNVVLGVVLTRIIGIVGTATATMLSFFLVWIVRAVDTYKFAQIKYEWKSFILPMIVLIVQAILLTIGIKSILLQTVLFFIIMSLYFKDILYLSRRLFEFAKKIIVKK